MLPDQFLEKKKKLIHDMQGRPALSGAHSLTQQKTTVKSHKSSKNIQADQGQRTTVSRRRSTVLLTVQDHRNTRLVHVGSATPSYVFAFVPPNPSCIMRETDKSNRAERRIADCVTSFRSSAPALQAFYSSIQTHSSSRLHR